MFIPEPLPPIQDEETYQRLLAECSALVALDPELGTPEGERLTALADVLEAYERKTFFI